MSRAPFVILSLCAALALTIAGCGEDSAQSSSEKPEVTVPDDLSGKQVETKDLIEGKGPAAKDGDQVAIHYVGVASKSGEEYESSWGGKPYSFTLGNGEVLAGWDEGIVGMKEGGRRELIMPSTFAYGKGGYPPIVGHYETVIYVIDLVSLN